MVIEITTMNAVNIDVGRGIIKHIDIYDRNNGHIEIEYRMKPMHDYPRGGRRQSVITILNSVTITTHQKSTTLVGNTKKVTCIFFAHWNCSGKYKVFSH